MKKIAKVLFIIFALVYVFIVNIHTFFSNSKANEVLSTKIFFAHFYSFPSLFGTIIAIFSVFILIIILISSIFFSLDKNIEVANVSCENSFKIVEWNALNSLEKDSAKEIFVNYDADIVVLPEFGGYKKEQMLNKE